jgi:hypothetical protein
MRGEREGCPLADFSLFLRPEQRESDAEGPAPQRKVA